MDLPTNLVVTFLSPISPPSKLPSNPASPDETPTSPLQSTSNPTTREPDLTSSLSTGLQFSNFLLENDQSENTQELPPFNFFLSDVRPLLERPNHLTNFNDVMNSTLIAHEEQNDPASIKICNIVSNQSFLHGKYFSGIAGVKNTRFKFISTFSMIGSTFTGDHRTLPLMSPNPLAPAFLPQYQYPSDPPISVCNSTTVSLPLVQLFCEMPPPIIPSPAFPITQPVTDDTFILRLIQPKNPSK